MRGTWLMMLMLCFTRLCQIMAQWMKHLLSTIWNVCDHMVATPVMCGARWTACTTYSPSEYFSSSQIFSTCISTCGRNLNTQVIINDWRVALGKLHYVWLAANQMSLFLSFILWESCAFDMSWCKTRLGDCFRKSYCVSVSMIHELWIIFMKFELGNQNTWMQRTKTVRFQGWHPKTGDSVYHMSRVNTIEWIQVVLALCVGMWTSNDSW